MKPVKTWILLADGAQARLFENLGPGKGLQPVKGFNVSQEPIQAQDIVTDKPGRAFSSVGNGRSAMEPSTDPVEKREDDFTRLLAEKLDAELQRENFDRLVVTAAPDALGNLRRHLSAHVRERIVAELLKDLTNVPAQNLPKHFDDVLVI